MLLHCSHFGERAQKEFFFHRCFDFFEFECQAFLAASVVRLQPAPRYPEGGKADLAFLPLKLLHFASQAPSPLGCVNALPSYLNEEREWSSGGAGSN